MDYKTPGVYTKEVSKFPPSVAQVETAIPVFTGFTEKAERKNESLLGKPTRITSLLDYEQLFGGARNKKGIVVTVKDDTDSDDNLSSRTLEVNIDASTSIQYDNMYYALQMFFANGGGACYVCSLHTYEGLVVELADDDSEYTISKLVFPDAVEEEDATYKTIADTALAQCADLQDRFAILDLNRANVNGDVNADMGKFRSDLVSNDNLKYGAAYYPYINTILPYQYDEGEVTVLFSEQSFSGNDVVFKLSDLNDKVVTSKLDGFEQVVSVDAFEEVMGDIGGTITVLADPINNISIDIINTNITHDASEGKVIMTGTLEFDETNPIAADYAGDFSFTLTEVTTYNEVDNEIVTDSNSVITGTWTRENAFQSNQLYNEIKKELTNLTVTLPPSSAIAGVYASVDNARGVWKSPANVSLRYVQGPSDPISSAEQEDMNVHTTGKSVNAIRSFTGKGTMVWGARTLAGNDNEWRYVSVRRFFNMVEESVKKASERYVFENNDARTWLQVRVMIENFLTLQWRSGALQGAKTDDAFYVRIGLGETMTPQDILEGRMIVEVGMAVVRPAEFIVLRFSHKLAES